MEKLDDIMAGITAAILSAFAVAATVMWMDGATSTDPYDPVVGLMAFGFTCIALYWWAKFFAAILHAIRSYREA